MSSEEGHADEIERRTRRLRYRIAFFLTALVALSVIVTLPFSVKSVVDDILGPATGRVVKISRDRPAEAHRNHTELHLAMVASDETQLLAPSACPGITSAWPATGATASSSRR
jgi:hypothetical protein